MIPLPPSLALFPYTTLFRSDGGPTGIFRCKGDEFIAIMVMPYQWKQCVAAMGMPELLTDSRFESARARRDNNEALKDIIDRKSTRLNSSHTVISYAVFCLKK